MFENAEQVSAAAFDAWVPDQPEERLFELIHGRVFEQAFVRPPRHSVAVTALISYLLQHLRVHEIHGYMTGETSGYAIGDKRCIPDGALILGLSPSDEYYSTNTPTLVIEMISNRMNSSEMSALALKREIYLEADITVWEGSTEGRYVDVYTPDGRYQRVRDRLTLDALPGLAIPLDKVFR